jgi:cysteine desulfurase
VAIYLDHAASTPVHPQVQRVMFRALSEQYGNPSSIHAPGRRARRAVEEAREAVADAINASSKEIIFTSGATEADNLAVRGLMAGSSGRLLTSPLEHSAVRAAARAVEDGDGDVAFLTPSPSGEVDVAALEQALSETSVKLVALMLVNNETGIRTRVEELAPVVQRAGALFFCDAVQAFGFEPLDVRALGVDALALSAHKAYGPKGVGALWLREGVEMSRITHGGAQERGLRPGTHNTPAIAAMGETARLASSQADAHGREVGEMRDLFEAKIAAVEGLTINGAGSPRGPKHSSVTVEGVEGEDLLMVLDSSGIYASAGSACSAGSIEPSHVLTAMGLSPEQARATLRFSFGGSVSPEQVLDAVEAFTNSVQRCRSILV